MAEDKPISDPEKKSTTTSSVVAIVVALIGAAATIIVAIVNKPNTTPINTPAPVSTSSAPTSGSVRDAVRYLASAKYNQAFPIFFSAAEDGNPVAACFLGEMYRDGLGVSVNDALAVSWVRNAAEHGSSRCMLDLARFYRDGSHGMPKNSSAMSDWDRKASEAKNPWGEILFMADMNEQSDDGVIGVVTGILSGLAKPDFLRGAAEQGNPLAMYLLARMYENGDVVNKDAVQADSWYRKAAPAALKLTRLSEITNWDSESEYFITNWGFQPIGMVVLGHLYEEGKGGLEKNQNTSESWYRRAAELGFDSDLKRLVTSAK